MTHNIKHKSHQWKQQCPSIFCDYKGKTTNIRYRLDHLDKSPLGIIQF